jgi:hypoxanthine-DNA glycosylase
LKREFHPYKEFLPKGATAMIIGSFPIGKFSDPERKNEIKSHELEFFFGGEKNLLWKLLGQVFNHPVSTRKEVITLLTLHGLAIGDVIKSCRRKGGGASDSDLYDVDWNSELVDVIRKKNITRVYFTSKKVEQWFNKLFKETEDLEKITLISPSAQSVRSITRREDFKNWIKSNPGVKMFEFILHDYKKKFSPGI